MKINYEGMFGCALGTGMFVIYTNGTMGQFLFGLIVGTIIISKIVPPKDHK